MFERLRQRLAWERELRKHTDKYFSGTMLRSLSKKAKREFADAFHGRCWAIDNEPDPFTAFRGQLVEAGLAWANLAVLTLKPNELEEMYVSPYISGQLHTRIRDTAKYDDWIASVCARPEPSGDDEMLYDAVQGQTVVNLYWLNGFNLLRAKYEPWSLEHKPNWFTLFCQSMLVWSEHSHREKLGMRPLCSTLFALEHSTFATFVRNGEREPLAAWETYYRRTHDAAEGAREQPLEHT